MLRRLLGRTPRPAACVTPALSSTTLRRWQTAAPSSPMTDPSSDATSGVNAGGARLSRRRLLTRPRSRAEWWGTLLGASIFPVAAGLVVWFELGQGSAERRSTDKTSSAGVGSGDGELVVVPASQLGGPFRLRESRTGKYITDEELFKNHWTLLYFGFSKCAEVCPTTLAFLADVMRRCDAAYRDDEETSGELAKLQAAFLSIDFLRDTPSVVEKFVARYEPRIRGLCGTRAEVEQAARVWRVYFSSVDETDEEREAREAKGLPPPELDDTFQFDHSSAIYLVGPDGKMKDFFFKEMGAEDMVGRLGVHFSNVYGFSDTRASTNA